LIEKIDQGFIVKISSPIATDFQVNT
jgi:hypothetical protein